MKKPYEIFYAVATGPERRRRLLTPVGLIVFTGLLLLVVFSGLQADQALALPQVLPGALGLVIGLFLLAVGLPLWAWCIVMFSRAMGTGVPFNPPWKLVVSASVQHSRNGRRMMERETRSRGDEAR